MEMDTTRYAAGLVFLSKNHLNAEALSTQLRSVMERNGQHIDGVQALSDRHIRLQFKGLHLDLKTPDATLSQDAPLDQVQMIAELTVTHQGDASQKSKRATLAQLATLCCDLAQATRPDMVQWLRPSTVLDTEDFIRAVARVMPRRIRARGQMPKLRRARPDRVQTYDQPALIDPACDPTRFPDVETTTRHLGSELDRRIVKTPPPSAEQAQNLRQAFTAPTHSSFAPLRALKRLAAALRPQGGSLRLASQISALTGLFAVLIHSGATAAALRAIGQ